MCFEFYDVSIFMMSLFLRHLYELRKRLYLCVCVHSMEALLCSHCRCSVELKKFDFEVGNSPFSFQHNF